MVQFISGNSRKPHEKILSQDSSWQARGNVSLQHVCSSEGLQAATEKKLCKGKLKQQMFHNERTVPYHSTIQPCLLELAQWDGA